MSAILEAAGPAACSLGGKDGLMIKETYEVTIGEKTVKLTREQLQELKGDIERIIPTPHPIPYIPMSPSIPQFEPYPIPYVPAYPPWTYPVITCQGVSAT